MSKTKIQIKSQLDQAFFSKPNMQVYKTFKFRPTLRTWAQPYLDINSQGCTYIA